MRIERQSMIERLDDFARAGNGLVTGEPGIGKTYSMAQLHDLWQKEGLPNQVVPVDRLGSISEGDIRSALGLDKDIVDHFAEYFTVKGRGVIVFDGFDSARNEVSRDRALSLIRRTIDAARARWTVLVTVRIYDATRSAGLRSLFRASQSPPFKGIGLEDTRVFEIPKLDEHELEQAISQVAGLEAIVNGATPELRELLRVPFNLWLTRQILVGSDTLSSLSAVASEVQLLGLYWKRRVLAGDKSLETRHVLTQAVGEMVSTHSLSVRREAVFTLSAAPIWSELLSLRVLEEVGATQQRVAFSHNILFDYAVSVLLMDDEPSAMNTFIAAEFSRPLFLRPSITYYYTRLWYDNRTAFWKSLWNTLASKGGHLQLVGRIVPPSVVVRESRGISDFEPVFARIDAGHEDARQLLLRIFQALSAVGWSDELLWSRVCIEAAKRPAVEYVWNVATVASRLGENGDQLSDDLRVNLGVVGRSLLRWALHTRGSAEAQIANGVGALWSVPLVAKTYSTAPEDSEDLLRSVLALLSEPRFPLEYLTRLCDSVESLFVTNPAFAADIYRAVYGHTESSEETTNFGTPIMPMRSTRRQDFGMCQYVLAQEFGKFLDANLRVASDAALDCFSAYVISDRVEPYLMPGKTPKDLAFSLTFRGRAIEVIGDHSGMWLDVAHPDDPLRLAKAVVARLKSAAESNIEEEVSHLLDSFASHATAQAAWVLLLRAGAAASMTLGPRLSELALSSAFRRGAYHDMTKFVAATFAYWPETVREAYERDIEAMYRGALTAENPEGTQHLADLFSTAIPVELTTSVVLASRRRELETTNGLPRNEPPFRFQTSSREFGNEEWLAEKGVDLEDVSNRRILELTSDLEGLVRQWQNKRPPVEAVTPLVEKISEGSRLLSESTRAAPDAAELLHTQLAAVAALIARAEGDVQRGNLTTAKRVLIAAAQRDLRIDKSSLDREFNMPSWSPIPQTEAAQGLPWLIVRERDEEVLNAIDALVQSPEPSVRFLVVSELFRLRGNAPEEFWKLVHRTVKEERSLGVLSGLLTSLSMINRSDAPEIADVLAELSKRQLPFDERSQFSDGYVRLLAWLAFNVQQGWATAEVSRLVEDPVGNYPVIKRLSFEALALLTPGYLADVRVRPMSLRAESWLSELLSAATFRAPTALEEVTPESGRALFGIADDVGSRLYFNIRSGGRDEPPDPKELTDYYATVKPLIHRLVEFAKAAGSVLAPRTAHHVIELLHVLLPLDPVGILHLVTEVAVVGAKAGYNLDGMAVKEVVEIAEDLLADYRGEIADGAGLEDFVRLLDTFADAGWPEALHLLWRLDEVFR